MSAQVPVAVDPSPRTPAQPMAFTPREFWRGALFALAVFQPVVILAVLALALITGGVTTLLLSPWFALFVPLYAVPASLFAWILAVGPAYVLGRSLRSVKSITVHVAAFAAFGLAVGAVVAAVFGTLVFDRVEPGMTLTLALSCAAAVAWGWAFTMRRALRSDRRTSLPARVAAVEKATLAQRAD